MREDEMVFIDRTLENLHIQENSFIFATGSYVLLMSLSTRRLARAKTQPFEIMIIKI